MTKGRDQDFYIHEDCAKKPHELVIVIVSFVDRRCFYVIFCGCVLPYYSQLLAHESLF